MSPRKGQTLVPESDQKKHQINIRLTEWEVSALSSIAERELLPVSHIVREGIHLFFQRYAEWQEQPGRGKKFWGSIGH